MYSEKKMTLDWKTNYQLEARNEKGISVKFDAPISHGGEETALSPMENWQVWRLVVVFMF